VADHGRRARDPAADGNHDLRPRALTGGGPGIATQLPALVVYDFMFQRGQIGRGAAAAVLMLLTLLGVLVPHALFKYAQQRRAANA
jgi:glucose/mannose transport system permease protein